MPVYGVQVSEQRIEKVVTFRNMSGFRVSASASLTPTALLISNLLQGNCARVFHGLFMYCFMQLSMWSDRINPKKKILRVSHPDTA